MKEPKHTILTIELNYSLSDLKKAYARFFGVKDFRKVKKGDIADWVSDMAQADVEMDMDKAISENES